MALVQSIDLSHQKFLEIEKTSPELNGKWVVIFDGKMLASFEVHEEAIDFALVNIPDGKKGLVSQVGARRIKKVHRIR